MCEYRFPRRERKVDEVVRAGRSAELSSSLPGHGCSPNRAQILGEGLSCAFITYCSIFSKGGEGTKEKNVSGLLLC